MSAHVEKAVVFYTADPYSRAESSVESLLNASRHVCVEALHKHSTKVLCNSLYFLHNTFPILRNDMLVLLCCLDMVSVICCTQTSVMRDM